MDALGNKRNLIDRNTYKLVDRRTNKVVASGLGRIAAMDLHNQLWARGTKCFVQVDTQSS